LGSQRHGGQPGVYVSYPAEELYAILSLESHRNRSIIVGEDLGIVPPEVRVAMDNHGLYRMYVLHFELSDNPHMALRPLWPNCTASLNTHDMFPFAAVWHNLDIVERLRLGLIDLRRAEQETVSRQAVRKALVAFLREQGWLDGAKEDVSSVSKACLSFLGDSSARIVLVNLEDLWLETKPRMFQHGQ